MRRAMLLMTILLLASGTGWAQALDTVAEGQSWRSIPPGTEVPEAWGTSYTQYTVAAIECGTYRQSDTWEPIGNSPKRYLTGADDYFLCPLHLPTGAEIAVMWLDFCDTSTTAEVTARLMTSPAAETSVMLAMGGSGVEQAVGCQGLPVALLDPPVQVQSYGRKYYVLVSMGTTSETQLASVRVTYRLRVSPAPSTATFPNDVPTTHPFFQFVEALADAGITGGCGTNSFCPDAAVTRGQMAVFLATALGLNFTQ